MTPVIFWLHRRDTEHLKEQQRGKSPNSESPDDGKGGCFETTLLP